MKNSNVLTRFLELNSSGENDIINITHDVKNTLYDSKLKNGIVVVFVDGSTASITTIEYEPGLIKDFPRMLERIIPKGIEYEHDNT